MNTKIVFTVTSGLNDIYLPQAMVAVYSARRYNPKADISLVIDKDTFSVLNKRLSKIKDYLNDIVIVNVDTSDSMSNMHKSRFLKTTLRKKVKGDFLYIDTDTVIAEDLSYIDKIEHDIGAVLDRHSLVSVHEFKKKIDKDIAIMGLNLDDLKDRYFNGGVMYVKDTPIAHQLYEHWHDNWMKSLKNGMGIDQPALALANKQCGNPIRELEGTWNCQLSDNFINYLADAKILHYFASNKRSPYKLYNNDIFKEVMEKGDIPEWLKKQLEHPKSLFQDKHILAYGNDVPYLRTNVHTMYIYHQKVFRVMEAIARTMIAKHI